MVDFGLDGPIALELSHTEVQIEAEEEESTVAGLTLGIRCTSARIRRSQVLCVTIPQDEASGKPLSSIRFK
jgi:hypothetical protein